MPGEDGADALQGLHELVVLALLVPGHHRTQRPQRLVPRGLGGVEPSRLDASIDQIGLVYTFKAKPKADDIFDASFLPPADDLPKKLF